jgi:hypothetical protein
MAATAAASAGVSGRGSARCASVGELGQRDVGGRQYGRQTERGRGHREPSLPSPTANVRTMPISAPFEAM